MDLWVVKDTICRSRMRDVPGPSAVRRAWIRGVLASRASAGKRRLSAQGLPQALVYRSFLIGIAKAPVFAMIVAIVGCFQGFRVSGSADSVGRKTTVSVVQSIFLVIVADAAFSILFSFIGI